MEAVHADDEERRGSKGAAEMSAQKVMAAAEDSAPAESPAEGGNYDDPKRRDSDGYWDQMAG